MFQDDVEGIVGLWSASRDVPSEMDQWTVQTLIAASVYHYHSQQTSNFKFIRKALVNDLYGKVFYVAFFILFSKTSQDVTPDKFLLSEL